MGACTETREQFLLQEAGDQPGTSLERRCFSYKKVSSGIGSGRRVTFKVTLERHLFMAYDAHSWGTAVINSAEGWRLVTSCTHTVICFLLPLSKTYFAFHIYSLV